MLVLTAEQMRAVDRAAMEQGGVPGVVLMENAGRGVADIIARDRPRLSGLRVRVVCGAGSNGGDGFVAARHLAIRGAHVRVFLCAPRANIRGDSAVFLRVLEALGDVHVEDFSTLSDAAAWRTELADSEVIIDAVFGTGLRDNVGGVAAAALTAVNDTPALRVAVDIPSGLDADTGRLHGMAVRADITATMGCRKLGLSLDPEAPTGRIEVVDLGIPIRPVEGIGPFCHWIDRELVFPRLPRRRATDHKGSSGHLLLIAGSAGKTGAALLAARAAQRAGAGLCTVASTAAGQVALDAKLVEAMSASFSPGDDARPDSYDLLADLAGHMRAAAVGPGIPTGPGMRALIVRLVSSLPLPMVVDADALNLLGRDLPAITREAPAPRILTPHPGEMARLVGVDTAAVQADRLGWARRLATQAQVVVILKGARTVVAAPDGTGYINPTANPALATAGSGDVLTGVIGGLCAQGVDPIAAATAGVFVHGLAGDLASERLGRSGVLAGDLPDAVAEVLAKARG